ncbi:MAG: trehalose-phosphatase [Ktedonobacteraceae bacterium]
MLDKKLQAVLAQVPLGLVFDFDGTLSSIAPTPEGAHLYPGVAFLLKRAKENAHIAIMTGRAIENGAEKVNVEGLTYIGTHGLEWSDGLPSTHTVEVVSAALEYVKPGEYLLDLVEQQLPQLPPGVIVQRKRFGGSIHYRLATNPEEAHQKIWAILAEPARRLNMSLSDGKRIVEIRVPLAVHKGQALRRFVQRFELQGVVFAGDDRTDLDAVLEITKLKQEGMAALAIVVQHPDTLPLMLEHADIVVQGVEGMVSLLGDMVEML